MSDELAPGTMVGGYRIERRLGAGGMGSVYLAKHPELPRHDALKVLSTGYAGDDGFRRRFLREAELAARLDHPNVVTIYNRGAEGGRLWIAMQYVAGDDCAVLLKRDPAGLDPAFAVHIIGQIARGLDRAHRAGLLHRDIKPANILVSAADEGEDDGDRRVVLTDFGVAKGGDEVSALTAVGTVLATLAYASPEQLCGEELDARSDQYSLAATFFHLITGKVPYTGSSTDAVIDAHFNAPPPRISQIRAGVPAAVDVVVARGLAKTPQQRYASCKEFANALRTAMSAPAPAHPVPPRPVSSPPVSSHPVPAPPVSSPPLHRPPHAPVPQPDRSRASGPVLNPGPGPGPGRPAPVHRSVAPGIRGQAHRAPLPAVHPPQPAPQPLLGGVPSGAMARPQAAPVPAESASENGVPPAVLVLVGVAVLAVLVLVIVLVIG